MMYEIYYEPSVGMWRIRIIKIYMVFIPISRTVMFRVQSVDGSPTFTLEPKEFDTYAEAVAEVEKIGLPDAYTERTCKGYASWLHSNGGLCSEYPAHAR